MLSEFGLCPSWHEFVTMIYLAVVGPKSGTLYVDWWADNSQNKYINKYSISLGNQQNSDLNKVLFAYFISPVIKDNA